MSEPTYDFFCDNGGEVIIPVAEFEQGCERVTLQESYYSNGTTYGQLQPYDADTLHPWERDLVANGAPFARPSNRVRS